MLGRVIPGDRLYTVTRHTSASGMTRSISTFVIRDNQPICIDYWVARLLDMSFDQKHGGCKTSGCGMDMGFEIVYRIGRVLYPDGYNLPEGAIGRNGDTSGRDTDGGYALKHEWL